MHRGIDGPAGRLILMIPREIGGWLWDKMINSYSFVSFGHSYYFRALKINLLTLENLTTDVIKFIDW